MLSSVITVLCLALSLTCLVASNKGKGRLERIENRLEQVEDRQDRANIARREDITELSLRLEDIETLVNNSAMGLLSFEPEHSAFPKDDSKIANELTAVQKAFAEEKSRWRRDASEMENKIKHDVKTVLDNVGREVKNDVHSLQMSIKDIKDTMLDEIKSALESSEATCSNNSRSFADLVLDKLGTLEQLVEERTLQKPEPIFSPCLELYRNGERSSGVYDVYPAQGFRSVKVFCDMTTDGGGWTVFQRRRDGSEDFFRGWQDYSYGFGKLDGEFWLGNELISSLTSNCCHELRVDLEDFEGNRAFAKYSTFRVFPREDNFRLEVSGYSGNASDSLGSYHSDKEFTTKDRDNDGYEAGNCADFYKGAWWYSKCHDSNLNGLYLKGKNTSRGKGVVWHHWKKTSMYSLKMTEMKFRPN